MLVNYNGVVRPMGYPFPLYFFMSADRKITPEQLKANLRRVVERYVTVAVNDNKIKTGTDHKEPAALQDEVKDVVNTAIKELLHEIVAAKIKVSPTSSASSSTASKVFNLGSYVSDMNAELNQMINDGIPL
jgi:hypothetical protein